MYRIKLLLVISILALFGSCRTVSAPKGSVPNRVGIATDAFGGWMFTKAGQRSFEGEFIAVGNDSLYILTSGKTQSISLPTVDTARIILYNTNTSGYALWTSLLSIGTLSNGAFATFTLPVSLVTGILITNAESKRINYFDYPNNSWEELKKYARFPQGLPKGIRTEDLKPRE